MRGHDDRPGERQRSRQAPACPRGGEDMRRWWIAVAAGACLAALFGCSPKQSEPGGAPAKPAQPAAGKPRPVIGVSVLTLTNPFSKEMGDAMAAEGAKRGYQVDVQSGEMDAARQR